MSLDTALMQKIRALHAAGASHSEIADQVGVSRSTVSRWLRTTEPPPAVPIRFTKSNHLRVALWRSPICTAEIHPDLDGWIERFVSEGYQLRRTDCRSHPHTPPVHAWLFLRGPNDDTEDD